MITHHHWRTIITVLSKWHEHSFSRNGNYCAVLLMILTVGKLCCVQVQAQEQERVLVPPSQDVAQAIVSVDSGMKTAITGKHWTRWYRIGVGKAPKGYTIQRSEFWLTGDRKCGDLAECREVAKSDQEVVWEFRFEGEEDREAEKQVSTEGHIRVTYRPRS